MTVGELIKKLQEFPQDLTVSAEGADCGRYDVVSGTNVYVEKRDYQGWGIPTVHIAYDVR